MTSYLVLEFYRKEINNKQTTKHPVHVAYSTNKMKNGLDIIENLQQNGISNIAFRLNQSSFAQLELNLVRNQLF